jgi:hypothetical protein
MEQNPGFIQLRRIDAAKDIATTISRSSNRYVFLNVFHHYISLLCIGVRLFRVYLDADSLLLNLMGDSKVSNLDEMKAVEPEKAKKGSW